MNSQHDDSRTGTGALGPDQDTDLNEAIRRLQRIGFFHDLTKQQLAALADCAQAVAQGSRQYLFQQNGPADAFYVIESGLVAIEIFTSHCRRVRVQTLRDGDLLGWSWLYPPYRWHFDALAMSDVLALRFDAHRVRALINADHELGFQLQARFTPLIIARLQAARLQLAEAVSRGEPDPDFTGMR